MSIMFKDFVKILVSTLVLLICSQTASGQQQSKFYVGGDLGLLFGTVTLVNISPKVGYNYNEKMSFGPGLIYQYYHDKRIGFKSNIYGASGFMRYRIFDNVAAYTEYQQLFFSASFGDESFLREVPVWFFGGQYIQELGNNVTFNVSILLDLIEDENSPYQNPFIAIGGNYMF